MKSLQIMIFVTVLVMLTVYSASVPNPTVSDFTITLVRTIDLWSLIVLPLWIAGSELIEANVERENNV